MAALWRRKTWVLAGMLVGIVAAVLFLRLATPRYVAIAQLLIDPSDLRVVDNAVTSPNALGDATVAQVESQVRVLASDNVLRRVVKIQALDKDPEFTQLGSFSSALGSIAETVGLSSAIARTDPALAALRTLEQRVSARRQERTYVVDLSVASENSDKAVSITNAIVKAYIEDQATARTDAARRATDALSSRLQELKDRVRVAEERAESYKAQNDIVGASGQLVKEQQLSELNNQLIQARARAAEAKARFEQIQRLQRSGADPGAIAEAVQSSTVAALRAQHAEIVRREAELNARLGGLHPLVADIKAQTRNLQQLIKDEIARLGEAARGDYERAAANQESLERSLDGLKREALTTGQALVRLRELEREVEASRAVYQAFLVRSRETSEQERLNAANLRVISEAMLQPRRAWPPRAMFVLPAGLMLGAAAAAGLALMRRQRDDRIRSRRDLEAVCGLPLLAEIADPSGVSRRSGTTRFVAKGDAGVSGAALGTIIDAPDSVFAMAVQRLNQALRASGSGEARRTILFLAAGAPGARAEVALNLALATAATQSSVLLVDADLDSRTLSGLLGGSGMGLIDVADHRAGFQEALLTEPRTGLMALRVASPQAPRSRATEGERALKVLENVRSFHTVVLDGPADGLDPLTRSLAEFADFVVLVVAAGQTRGRDIVEFLRLSEVPAGKLRGVVLVDGTVGTA